ncbi:Benzoylformate decarboxylase [Colletotrichum fructicola]|nr:Benzoylformate decarboxylase [Colletotrichum fructicola]
MTADIETYSASFAFFEGLYEAGVSHVFVNLGSDHPAIMEALAHGAQLKGVKFPRVITCPHELSHLPSHEDRQSELEEAHNIRMRQLDALAEPPEDKSQYPTTSYLVSQLRKICPEETVWCVEAVTNAPKIYDQLRVDKPGHLINCGGGGLGWSGGATLGVKLALDFIGKERGETNFVCEIVGDGTYLFGCPGTVYWVAARYNLPTLTIVLSNKGWNAPRNSLQLVHPSGYGAASSNEDLNISFSPTPDYSGIAKAASGGQAWAGVASSVQDLGEMIPAAVQAVKSGISAILEVRLNGSW